MIIIKNREMIIPNDEQTLGTNYDAESENRQFRIKRFTQSGVDISGLTFRMDLRFESGGNDTMILTKEVEGDNITLTATFGKNVLSVAGTLWVALRAIDGEATVRWSSYTAAFYVERHLNTPGSYTGDLTELEQIEQDHLYMLSVVDELRDNLDYRSAAEAAAIGTRHGVPVDESDEFYHNNAKYYSDQIEVYEGNAEAWAKGTKNGVPVTDGDPGYHDNSLYYAQQSESFVDDAEAWAKGTRAGEAVTSGDPTYHKNSKYYADVAKDYADNIADPVSGIVAEWIDENLSQETGYVIDVSLETEGAAADAKATGKAIGALKSDLTPVLNDVLFTATNIKLPGYVIGASGKIGPGSGDGFGYRVNPADIINITTQHTGLSFSYGFFVSKPEDGSVSYNGDRVVVSAKYADNVTVPDGCYWVFIKVAEDGFAIINPVVSDIDNLYAENDESNAKISTLEANKMSIQRDIESLFTDVNNVYSNVPSSDIFNDVSFAVITGAYLRKQTGSEIEYETGAYTKILVAPGEKYYVSCKLQGSVAIVFYNGDDYIAGQDIIDLGVISSYEVTVPNNATKMGVSTYNYTDYPIGITAKSRAVADLLDVPRTEGYIYPRRPIICFTLDGDYDLNPTMLAIAEAHGYRLTFAVRYTSFTDDAMAVVRRYKTWEQKGHEVAIHTNDSISGLTNEEVEQVFKTAYARGKKYGFNVRGVVARSGEWRNNLLDVAKQRVDYFASQPNHAGSNPEVYHTFPGDPYMLWRYSMQTATLDQQKAAVDACIANKGLLMFYGHARTSEELLNFTPENFDALLTYIDSYTATFDVAVKTTWKAIKDFYSVRYEDITNLIN